MAKKHVVGRNGFRNGNGRRADGIAENPIYDEAWVAGLRDRLTARFIQYDPPAEAAKEADETARIVAETLERNRHLSLRY